MYASHPAGVKTALKIGNKYRVLTTFPDATELVRQDLFYARFLDHKYEYYY